MTPGSTWQNHLSNLEAKREAIERVVSRPPLQNSEALCNLLRYLADRTFATPEAHIKEHQIAIEVFGRPETFDPRVDSTVRVQTSRLRAKLGEYYAGPGSNDSLHIEIPKGTYSINFHPLTPPELPPPPAPDPPDRWYKHHLLIFLALLGSLAVIGTLLAVIFRSNAHKQDKAGSSVAEFWQAVLGGSEEPLVVFSNAQFVGRPETGIRYLKPGEAPANLFDLYTGIGEVFAIHALDQAFALIERHYILKRGRLLNWDETKNRDLVFVGSPSENLPLRELPINRNFVFGRVAGPRAGDLGILNLHPMRNEAQIYYGSKDSPITDDYAVVEFSTGAVASQRMLLLAGTTTFGTQGAVEFVCKEDRVSVLLRRLGSHRPLKPFSVLLHVRVQGGVPLDSDLVTSREN